MGFSSIISMMSPKSKLFDQDAQLFFNAQTTAGVTLTTTQMNAVNQWVIDAKAVGIWTKMKAIYPMVGGTATAHKFNLKNPLDTDAAYRLSFVGGGTHSSNGYQPGGVNGYANTFLIPSSAGLGQNSTHISYYSKTNNDVGVDIGSTTFSSTGRLYLYAKISNTFGGRNNNNTVSEPSISNLNGLGYYINNRIDASNIKLVKNGITTTSALASTGVDTVQVVIGAVLGLSSIYTYGSKQCAFASIGDGLTDLESQVFYQITEKFQVALGRNVNATQSFYYNPAYNNETNAFLFSTQITDATIQTATNTLVTDLKTAGVFTKMKAIYPMVGGTATTNKFNLANAQDTDAAYRLVFSGGGTFSANGYLPNGINSFANTFLIPSTILALNSTHMSYYSRTSANGSYDMGSQIVGAGLTLNIRDTGASYIRVNTTGAGTESNILNADGKGFYQANRNLANIQSIIKNNTINNFSVNSVSRPTNNILIGAINNPVIYYGNKECAFASIGDGLTDAEALAFYNAVQTFNTTLARQV